MNHEMVLENSPGPKAFGPGLGPPGNPPCLSAVVPGMWDEGGKGRPMSGAFSKRQHLLLLWRQSDQTITYTEIFQGNEARCHNRSTIRPPFSSFARYRRAMADRQGGLVSGDSQG
jgi:hypothetical protein